jgi:hypothetical protein
VVDVFHREIKLVLVVLGVAAEFAAAIGEHAKQCSAKNDSTRSFKRSAAVIGVLRS